MLATSRMLPSTRWMHAVWWRRLRAEALAGDRRLGRPMPFQTTFPHERLHRVHTSSSRPIRRWPYLIRSGRVVEVAAAEAEAVVVAEAEVVVQVGVARAAAVAEAVARVAEAQGGGAGEGVVRVAPVQVAGREAAVKAARAEAQEEAREAAPAVAGTIPSVTITSRPTT